MAIKHRISVSLSEEEYRQLAGMADRYRVSMAWLSRQAIMEYLERHEVEDLQLPIRLRAVGKRGDELRG